jgi:hypothetical protein
MDIDTSWPRVTTDEEYQAADEDAVTVEAGVSLGAMPIYRFGQVAWRTGGLSRRAS